MQRWPLRLRSVAAFGRAHLRNRVGVCSTACAFCAGIVLEMFVYQYMNTHKDLLCFGLFNHCLATANEELYTNPIWDSQLALQWETDAWLLVVCKWSQTLYISSLCLILASLYFPKLGNTGMSPSSWWAVNVSRQFALSDDVPQCLSSSFPCASYPKLHVCHFHQHLIPSTKQWPCLHLSLLIRLFLKLLGFS